MPRSSKHKTGKHSSKDAREYSDSEEESSLKDRKSKEESVTGVSKELSSVEKRKLDGKDLCSAVNGEHSNEHGSSKRRKERSSDGVGARWNGGEEERPEGFTKSKASGDSKSRKRDASARAYGDGEEVRKSSGKSEGEHRDSGKGETDMESKHKEGRSERLVDSEEQRPSKRAVDTSDVNAPNDSQSAEPNGQLVKQVKKRRNGYGEEGKHAEEGVEVNDRPYSSKDESGKDGRHKEEKRKDEKYRDKHREEIDRDSKHRHEKQRDCRALKEHTGSRADENHARELKEAVVSRQKKMKSQGDRTHDHSRNCDGDRSRDWDSNPESSHGRERHYERARAKDRDDNMHDHSCHDDHDLDYDRDRDWEWEHGRENDRNLDREDEHDRDGFHIEDRCRYKDGLSRKRSLHDCDDYIDSKYRVVKAHYSNAEKRTMCSGRADSDVDEVRSQSHQVLMDCALTSNQRRSPVHSSYFGKEYRILDAEDVNYRDSMIEHRLNDSRDLIGFSGIPERGSKYKSMDRPVKTDDSPVDIPTEKSSGSKTSLIGLVERSPLSTSINCRYMRKGMNRSLDFKESSRWNSNDPREFTPEDRGNLVVLQEKPLLDDSTLADSSFYGRISQGNTSGALKIPSFRVGFDRPFMGSLDDDARDNSNARHQRSIDPCFGRGPGNAWRGVPKWTSPVPINFVRYQHGPAHGSFQAMLPEFPQFPPQPMFSAKPPMEVNQTGFPYHIPEADRFAGHLRPFSWQNIMGGTGPSHLHGWDGNGSVFRDGPHMHDNSEWDWSRKSANSQAWELGSEPWKEHNGDVKDFSPSSKDEYGLKHPMDDVSMQGGQMLNDEMEKGHRLSEKVVESKSCCFTSANETSNFFPAAPREKNPNSSALSKFDIYRFSHFYLSKLDISSELSNPEVYDQCMALLSPKTSTQEDDIFVGARVSVNPFRPSCFPLVGNSVFQRAMDLYKKQRAELCIISFNETARDKLSASYNQSKVKEQGAVHKSDLQEIFEFSGPEMKNVLIPALNNDIAGSVTSKGCRLDMSSLDGEGCLCSSSLKLVVCPFRASGHEELGEWMMPVSMENDIEKRLLEMKVNKWGAKGHFFSPKNNVKVKCNATASSEDEMVTVNNSASGPLIFQDGSF